MDLELLSVQQVADLLGFKPITVYRITRKGKIDVIVLGKSYKYTRQAVDKYIASCTIPAKE
jgi:excisionase family DNA binding protein